MPEESPEESLRETMEELERAISEAPRICPNCGRAVPDDAMECPHCGASLVAAVPRENAEPVAEEAPPTTEVIEAVPSPAAVTEPQEIATKAGADVELPEIESAPYDSVGVSEEQEAVPEELEEDVEPSIGEVPTGGMVAERTRGGRLWGPVAVGTMAYLFAIPIVVYAPSATIPSAALMVLGAVAVAVGVGLSRTRGVEPVAMAVVTQYVCPLCGTDVAPDTAECPTCGARLTD